jgi:hypothetical protein
MMAIANYALRTAICANQLKPELGSVVFNDEGRSFYLIAVDMRGLGPSRIIVNRRLPQSGAGINRTAEA